MTVLNVLLPGKQVGTLGQDRSGLVQWVPDIEWQRNGQHPRLGAEFLRTLTTMRVGTGVPIWFENLLPEPRSELRKRLCAAFNLRDGQSFRLLEKLGRDLIGAVELVNHEGHSPVNVEAEFDSKDEQGDHFFAGHRPSALTGMQLKFSMSMANERLALPAKGRGGLWIVKLPGRDYPELAEVELACMRWAKHAGFSVPECFIAKIGQLDGIPQDWLDGAQNAFAIRRFDRSDDGSKVHQEDYCQALNIPPNGKFGDLNGMRVAYDALLRFTFDICGEADAREFARRLGFVIASGNTDAHLKNWALLWGMSNRPGLTPCYDLVSMVSWERYAWGPGRSPQLALRLGGVDGFASITRDLLVKVVEKSAQSWAAEEIEKGILQARDSWASVEEMAPQRMRDAIEETWRRVPLLRDIGLRKQ